MPDGWQISSTDGTEHRTFKVGIADQRGAMDAVIAKGDNPNSIVALPLKDVEREEIDLSDWEVCEIE